MKVTELKEMLPLGGAGVLVDVRNPEEFAQGHIEGAINIPVSNILFRATELESYSDIYLICRSGSRSQMAQILLRTKGVKAVNVEGGMIAWQSAN